METLLNNILTKIKNAISQKGHAFKYGSLASSYSSAPYQRMVVLRAFKQHEITIYTDSRSQKVSQFSSNPNASLLLFDTETMEQVILKGIVKIEKDNIESIWSTVPQFAHRDYTSVFSPGEPIDHEIAKYSDSEHHFCMLKFSFSEIDYLKIDRPYNSRSIFKLNEQNQWKGTFVVP